MSKSISGGVEIINTLSTKNDGDYPLVMAESVGMKDGANAEDVIKNKLNTNQGTENNGKFMKVGADGNLKPEIVPIPDVSAQINTHDKSPTSHNDIRDSVNTLKNDKLDKNQGVNNTGKIITVGDDGNVVTRFPNNVTYNPDTKNLEYGSNDSLPLIDGVKLDTSLTKGGFAADAKITGDKINKIESEATTLKSAFEDLGGSFELYKQKMFSDYVIDKSVYADIASKCFTGMEQKNICAFGDSITAQAKWYEPLKSYLGASNIYNRGIGGTCIGGSGANAMWQDVRINALEKDIDCLLIMGGINDSAQGVTIGEISRDNLDTSTFVGAYNVLLSKVYCKYYHLGTYEGITQTTEVKPIKIMLATPIYCNDPTYGNMDNIAEAVRGIANMWGIPVADQHAKSGINAVTAELYLADNVHPNDEGGKRVANVWGNALRESAELN